MTNRVKQICHVVLAFLAASVIFISVLVSAQTPIAPVGKPANAGPIASTPSGPDSPKRLSRKVPEDYDPLLDPPPLPHSSVTLIGAIVIDIDEIQNRITVRPFAGKQRIHLNFDVRTHIFREGSVGSGRDLRPGERVYLDTMLDGSKIFAKNIWIRNSVGTGSGRGQVLKYDSRTNTLTLRDEVSAEPVSFRLDSATIIHNGTRTGSVADLKPDSLVAIAFDPKLERNRVITELTVLAEPGSTFTFLGKITFVDLSQKLIAVTNQSDDKNYDVYYESIPSTVLQGLREGSQASISALFDGSHYLAQRIDLITSGQSTGQK